MSTKKYTKRIEYIDIARGLAILLVVCGHWLKSGTLRNMIYAFHMPLFFIISGLVLKERKTDYTKYDFAKLLKKRIFSYYIPYIIWALFYAQLNLMSLMYILYGSREALKAADSVTSLWFLPSLMLADIIAECILFLIRKQKKKNILIIVFMIALGVFGFVIPHLKPLGYPLGFDVSLMGCAFIFLGYLVKSIITYCNKNIKLSLSLCVLSCLIFVLAFFYYPNSIKTVNMYNAKYGSTFPFLIESISGSATVLMFSCFVDRLLPKKRILVTIGTSTLGILVMHKPMVAYIRNTLNNWGYNVNHLCISMILGSILIVLICTLLTQLLLKVTPFLLGKQRQ